MSTFDALCKILVRDYALTAGTLTPETTLASVVIDSLGVIELIFAIEETFDVTVPDDDPNAARDFGTLAELSAYVDQLISARDGGDVGKPVEAAAVAPGANTVAQT